MESSLVSSEDVTDVSGKPSGVIRWKVSGVKDLDDAAYSDTYFIEGLPWTLKARTDERTGVKHLAIFIFCNDKNESPLWSVDARLCIILSHPDGKSNMEESFATTFSMHRTNRGFHSFVEWEVMHDLGFVVDDSINIEVRFYLSNIRGFRPDLRYDFSTHGDLSDLTLVLGEKKVHVSKHYLALHSPVFAAMFFGDYAEKNKEEIDLKDVQHEEFVELLRVIYPSNKGVDVLSVHALLKLGDRFQIKTVLDRCEAFAVDTNRLTMAEKLQLSDQYRLCKLQNHCLLKLKSLEEVKTLKDTDQYALYSDAMKVTLFEKMMRLMK